MKNNRFTVQLVDIMAPNLETDGCLFIVTEFIEQNLRQMIDKSWKLDFMDEHIIELFYNILCALNYLHSTGLMHRDLKPDNIFISEDGGVKIFDLNFARTVPGDLVLPEGLAQPIISNVNSFNGVKSKKKPAIFILPEINHNHSFSLIKSQTPGGLSRVTSMPEIGMSKSAIVAKL